MKYIYEREKEKDLFKKALKEICFLTNLRPQQEEKLMSFMDRESLQLEIELKKRDLNEYAYFLTYKIVHYIEAFYSSKITKFIAEYTKDDFNNLWLVNCCRIKSFDTNTVQDVDYVLKKVNLIDSEQKNNLINNLDNFYDKASKIQKKKIEKISNQFIQKYEKTKEQLGIDLNARSPEDSFSDNVFRNLNPDNPFTLTQILKSSHKPSLKRYILQNFPENLMKYDKECQNIEALDSKPQGNLKIRPISHKTKNTEMTKRTNYTSFNKTGTVKFGVDYEKKNKKQEKFLSLCHNGFNKPKNIDYNNFLGEMVNLRKDSSENNVAVKVKNIFEIKKIKEKPKTFQLKNNFFKDHKEIETNAIDFSKYALKNLESTLPYLLYHKNKRK